MKCDNCGIKEEEEEFMIWVGENKRNYNFCSKRCYEKYDLKCEENQNE